MKEIYKIVSFYCFSPIKVKLISEYKDKFLNYEYKGLSGLLILAEEGINGTICGGENIVDQFYELIKQSFNNQDLHEKISFSPRKIFKRLKVKLKSEIVTMGINDIKNNLNAGIYVNSNDWNSLIKGQDTLIIDTRNHYEVSLGTFKNSVNPETRNFREFPKWIENNLEKYMKDKNTNIAMFCTGGIRCEKATSLLKKKGYKNVYHLKGGILKYFEEIDPLDNLYEGECYVFDERVSVDSKLSKGSYSICHACGMPLSKNDLKKKQFIKGIQCHLCVNKFSDEDRRRFAERQKQIDDKLNGINKSLRE